MNEHYGLLNILKLTSLILCVFQCDRNYLSIISINFLYTMSTNLIKYQLKFVDFKQIPG